MTARSLSCAAACRRYGLRLLQVLHEGPDSFTARVSDATGRQLVLKRLARDEAYRVRRGLVAWAPTGLTPCPVGQPEPDLLLLAWIPGAPLHESPRVRPPDVARIGRSLRQLHAVAAPADLPDIRDSFPGLAGAWNALPADLQPLATALTLALEAADPSVLLHGDLVPHNIILTDDGPRFIDPMPARGFPSWDLAKLIVSWAALGRPAILGPLIDGYGSRPALLAEAATWIALVYLEKNLPHPASPLRPHLLPLLQGLREAGEPEAFLARCLSR